MVYDSTHPVSTHPVITMCEEMACTLLPVLQVLKAVEGNSPGGIQTALSNLLSSLNQPYWLRHPVPQSHVRYLVCDSLIFTHIHFTIRLNCHDRASCAVLFRLAGSVLLESIEPKTTETEIANLIRSLKKATDCFSHLVDSPQSTDEAKGDTPSEALLDVNLTSEDTPHLTENEITLY